MNKKVWKRKTALFGAVVCMLLPSINACQVNVGSGHHDELLLSFKEKTVEVGASFVLAANVQGEVEWLIEDEEIVTMTEDGDVIGLSIGETSITAVYENLNAVCNVTVVENTSGEKHGYTMVWKDEFDGNALNAENWGYQYGSQDTYGSSVGPQDWGNNELQYYNEESVTLSNGALEITARKEAEKVGGKDYTSGRILTRDKYAFTYGYLEARIKAPAIDGMWPAFWLMPQPTTTENSDNVYGGWPEKGEIDIMEIKGRVKDKMGTALHFGKSSGKDTVSQENTLSSPIDQWHTYAVDKQKEYIAWIVDGVEVMRVTYDRWWSGAVNASENPYAPFDQPVYVILNLAVGGNYDPLGTTNLKNNEDFTSASMYVDYVRLYEIME